jgi:hypothetical protein
MNVAMLVTVIVRMRVLVGMRMPVRIRCSRETDRGSRARFGGLYFAVPRRGLGGQGAKQLLRDSRHAIDGAIERFLVRLRRFGEAAQFPDELERRSADLVLRGRRREVMQGFDVSTHKILKN